MIRRFLLFIAAALPLYGSPLAVVAFDVSAREAILIDHATGTVLLQKNADEPTYPSSMTKMMTVYLLFEALAEGRLSLDDELPVSEKAWRMGGSKMFVEVGTRVGVEDLIRGIVVHSGNDATIVVAEGLAGSEEAFAVRMTEKARELGMTNTVFRNASGWPDPDHISTARDLAILAQRTVEDFPQYYPYYAETTFTYHGIEQGNRNPLLYTMPGADGLKTGHTQDAGYGLTASAERDGRRLILVINGVESNQQRSTEAQRLLEWGFREFQTYALFSAGEVVGEAEVWLGAEDSVPLVVEDDVAVTMTHAARRAMEVKIVYEGPLPAPIASGTPVARLVVHGPDMAPLEVPLLAGADIDRGSLFSRVGEVIVYLIFGSSAPAP